MQRSTHAATLCVCTLSFQCKKMHISPKARAGEVLCQEKLHFLYRTNEFFIREKRVVENGKEKDKARRRDGERQKEKQILGHKDKKSHSTAHTNSYVGLYAHFSHFSFKDTHVTHVTHKHHTLSPPFSSFFILFFHIN